MTQIVVRPADHPKINALPIALKYAEEAVSGRIVVGKLVKKAAERFLFDLEHGHERGLEFDEVEAQFVVDFFGFLKHSKGEWGDKVFRLEPWQVFILCNIFGWKKNGVRRFTEAYIEVARKNGKTTFLAGIGLYLLLMDGEPGAEVYSAATKKDQARICFDEAVRMRKSSAFIKERVQAFGQKYCNRLFVESTNSKYEPLSSEDNTLDGLNSHAVLIDELHAHPDRKLYDVLSESTKARRQPLVVAITTAGYDQSEASICWVKRGRAISILEGGLSNASDQWSGDNIFAFIACLDPGDNYFDETTWPKANPNLEAGVVKLRALREAAAEAKQIPTALNSFLRKHMNVWTSQDERFIDPEKWRACNVAGSIADVKQLRSAAMDKLKNRKCFGGLDLSSKIDLASYYLIFPPLDANDKWHILGWNWIPELRVIERVQKDHIPYDTWVRERFLLETEGNVIDQNVIRKHIVGTKNLFRIEEIGFDSWNSTQISIDLQSEGLKMCEARQGFKTFSEPTKLFLALTIDKKFEHYGDPVLTWAVGNVAVEMDPAGNIKPSKEKAKEKIDPVVALLMAMSRAVTAPVEVKNPYNERGILFI